MASAEILKSLGMDIKGLLLEQKAADLEQLLDKAVEIKIKNLGVRNEKGFLVGLLMDEEYFSIDDLLNTIDNKNVRIDFGKLLEEPSCEDDMKKAVIEEFHGSGFITATEVPMGNKGAKSPRIDVAVLKRGRVLGAVNVYGFELKQSSARGEILKAFAQAKAYQEYCEQTYVVFSPLSYIKQYDEIQKQIKEHKEIGVWVVNARRKLASVHDAYALSISDSKQKEICAFIEGEKGGEGASGKIGSLIGRLGPK